MEKLILERSPAEQGNPVKVYVSGSRGRCGEFVVTFEEWIHFNKLLKEGIESLKRKNETRIEVLIRGVGEKEAKKQKEGLVITSIPVILPNISPKQLDKEVGEIMAGMVKPVTIVDVEELAGPGKNEGLVRSLIRERG